MKNLFDNLGNAKTRTLLLSVGSVFVVGMIVAVASYNGNASTSSVNSSRSASVPSSIKPTPGTSSSERYKKLQEEDNKKRAAEAKEKNTSSISTIVGNENKQEDNLLDVFKKKEAEKNTEIDRLLELQKQQAKDDEQFRRQQDEDRRNERLARLEEERKRNIEAIVAAMDGQAKAAMKSWVTFTSQSYVSGDYELKENNQTQDANIPGSPSQTDGSDPNSTGKEVLVKAGTVLFGVIDTSVNTDEPSPILARIVQGKFKDSKIVGSVKKSENKFSEKIILNFTLMNSPQYEQSIPISMVAIDPETARTAMASNVDHHYLTRYGSLFASAFMEGFGEAISEQGTVTESSGGGSGAGGSTTTTKPKLNGREQLFSALGNVGTKWGEVVGENYNRPITITVNAGTGIGLLVMNDISV